jgi:hypothetical protein
MARRRDQHVEAVNRRSSEGGQTRQIKKNGRPVDWTRASEHERNPTPMQNYKRRVVRCTSAVRAIAPTAVDSSTDTPAPPPILDAPMIWPDADLAEYLPISKHGLRVRCRACHASQDLEEIPNVGIFVPRIQQVYAADGQLRYQTLAHKHPRCPVLARMEEVAQLIERDGLDAVPWIAPPSRVN